MKLLALDPGYLTGLMYVKVDRKGGCTLQEHGFLKEKDLFYVLENIFRHGPPDRVLIERTGAHPVESRLTLFIERKKSTVLYTIAPTLVHATLFGRLLSNRDDEGFAERLKIAQRLGIRSILSIHELDALLLIQMYLQEGDRRQEDLEDPMWFYDVIRILDGKTCILPPS